MEGSSGLRPHSRGRHLVLCSRSFGPQLLGEEKGGRGGRARRQPQGWGKPASPHRGSNAPSPTPWLQSAEGIPASLQPGWYRHTGRAQPQPADLRGIPGAPQEERERAAPYVTVHTARWSTPGKGGCMVAPALPIPRERQGLSELGLCRKHAASTAAHQQQELNPAVLEARLPGWRCRPVVVWRGLFLADECVFLLCSHVEEGLGLCRDKDANHIMGAPLSQPHHPQRSTHSSTITLGLGFN